MSAARLLVLGAGHLLLSGILVATVYARFATADYAVGVSNQPLTPLTSDPAGAALLVLQLPLIVLVVLGPLAEGTGDSAALVMLGLMALGNAAVWALALRAGWRAMRPERRAP